MPERTQSGCLQPPVPTFCPPQSRVYGRRDPDLSSGSTPSPSQPWASGAHSRSGGSSCRDKPHLPCAYAGSSHQGVIAQKAEKQNVSHPPGWTRSRPHGREARCLRRTPGTPSAGPRLQPCLRRSLSSHLGPPCPERDLHTSVDASLHVQAPQGSCPWPKDVHLRAGPPMRPWDTHVCRLLCPSEGRLRMNLQGPGAGVGLLGRAWSTAYNRV